MMTLAAINLAAWLVIVSESWINVLPINNEGKTMPFGQSVAIRFGAKAIAAAMGADPVTQAVVGRSAGWVAAHLTLDHHSQAVAEFADGAHDAYNVSESVQHVVAPRPHFGGDGPCKLDTCGEWVDANQDKFCDTCHDDFNHHAWKKK